VLCRLFRPVGIALACITYITAILTKCCVIKGFGLTNPALPRGERIVIGLCRDVLTYSECVGTFWMYDSCYAVGEYMPWTPLSEDGDDDDLVNWLETRLDCNPCAAATSTIIELLSSSTPVQSSADITPSSAALSSSSLSSPAVIFSSFPVSSPSSAENTSSSSVVLPSPQPTGNVVTSSSAAVISSSSD
jgi:hypothetical protein